MDKIQKMLDSQKQDLPRSPSQILTHLYIGDHSDQHSVGLLQDLGITHILNCAGEGGDRRTNGGRYVLPGQPVSYMEFEADDIKDYNIVQHFEQAAIFIEDARKRGGKVLVCCARGMNRSAAICVGYLMSHMRLDLLPAVRAVLCVRGRILTNVSFRSQLVNFAQSQNLLNSQ